MTQLWMANVVLKRSSNLIRLATSVDIADYESKMANSTIRGYQRQNDSRRRTEGLLATETATAVRAAYSSKELRRLASEQALRLRTTATMLDGVSHQEAAIVRRCTWGSRKA
jgi:hypothetical protein